MAGGTAFKREKELLNQQDILARFGELALRSEDLQEILDKACHLVGEALGTDLATVMEIQQDQTTLLVRSGVGWPAGVVGQVCVKLDVASSEGHALKTKKPVVSADINTEQRFEYAGFIKKAGVRALANVPIISAYDKPAYGILQVDSRTHREFSDADISFLRGYANLLAGAVARLKLLDEMRQAHEAIRDSEEVLRQKNLALAHKVQERTRERDRLWHLSRDPFLIANTQGLWLRANPAWTKILDWSSDELVGRTCEWLEHPQDQGRTRAEIESLAAGTAIGHFENRLRARDGSYHWFSWTAASEGDLLFCVARDITDEKARATTQHHLEEQLHQSQKMEAVGQLTGGLAHDFNNMLAGIVGSLDLLQVRVDQGRTDTLNRYIAMAQAAASRAAGLTRRLLAFSRRQALEPKPTDMNALVVGMQDMLQRTVGPDITFEIIAVQGLPRALVDANQLENALLNLCINARDAMPQGGRLSIEFSLSHVDEALASTLGLTMGRYLTLCVSDTGSGMTPEVLARAFEPFFTTKEEGKGTGLGLSMIYGFARQSGGQAHIVSEPGLGTTVSLYLPPWLGDTIPLGGQVVLPEVLDGQGQTVLVVDDEATIRMLVCEVLLDLGYTTMEAADGAAALRILRSKARVDLLMTDVGLPGGMTGRQMADAARGLRPDLKVLFITGYSEETLGDEHMKPGMQVLTKPFAMQVLTARVREMISEQ